MLIECRYGEDGESQTVNSAFRELLVPSPILRQHNLELIVSSIQVDTVSPSRSPTDSDSILDVLLAPSLVAPVSAAEGYSSVTYPVHKTILLGNGLPDLVNLGRFISSTRSTAFPADLIQLAIVDGRAGPISASEKPSTDDVILVDTQKAETAISQFRQSVNNAVAYEHSWFESNLPSLISWLSRGSDNTSALKPSIKSFIDSVLMDTEARIDAAAVALQSQIASALLPDSTRSSLSQAITSWAERAHAELQDSLEGAFRGSWSRLKWWKLFWRVDDVGMISSEIMERKWLVEAEKELIFLSGRMKEAHLINNSSPASWTKETKIADLGKDTETNSLSVTERPPVQNERTIEPPSEKRLDIYSKPVPTKPPSAAIPYPQRIPLSRNYFLTSDIPGLQTKAQALVMQCLTTTALTSALGGLIYTASPLTTVFESGAIAALGFVIAISRLQSKWEAARTSFEVKVRDDGRRALLGTEDDIRAILRRASQVKADESTIQSIDVAKKAVERAKEALWRMGEK
jgi:hypothetical protein